MATRKQVAERAGVSEAVVSFVVNGKSNVKEETRRRVLAAIEELGYRPNPVARSLKLRKSQQIAVLVNHMGNPFEMGILLGLESASRRSGYFMFVQTYSADREADLPRLLIGRVDAIVLLGQSLRASTYQQFRKAGMPILSVTTPAERIPDMPVIDVDWRREMHEIVHQLERSGHRHVAFMTHSDPRHPYRHRCKAFLEAVAASGLTCGDQQIIAGEGTFERATEALLSVLLQQPAFTAIVCANDLMAIGALDACRRHGIDVPRRMSVIGCEDILMSSQTSPALTVMHYPREEVGQLAMNALLKLLDGEPQEDIILQGKLLARDSHLNR